MTFATATRSQPISFMNFYSRAIINYVIYIFIFFVISGVGKACKFPRHLETNAIWTAKYRDNSTFYGHFQGNLLRASRCDGKGNCVPFTRLCLFKRDKNKYEVEHKERGVIKPSVFLCMQILERGRSIIQIRQSAESFLRKSSSCDDNNLSLDNWPIVTTEHFDEQKIPCSFSGGYNIRLHTSDRQPKCDREIIPIRLESECEQGDGMTIDFHTHECLEKDMQMQVQQPLYCVATWIHGNYTFVILRPQSGDYKAWCMRITGTDFSRPIEHGHLFIDLVCDPGDGSGNIRETSRYLYLEFTQRIISSTCADSYPHICDDRRMCNLNDETYTVNCRQFCNHCSAEQSLCTFPGSLQGNWIGNGRHKEQNEVSVSYYDIDIKNTGQFQCLESEGHDFENKTVLLQTFSNGCYPRYACFEVKKVSPSILECRLGNRVGWPVQNWDRIKEEVCSHKEFEPSARDKEKFGGGIEEKPTTILVDMEHHYPVNCYLEEWPGLMVKRLNMQEMNVCEYCFVYNLNYNPDRFFIQPFNCTSNQILERKDYHCLGAFPQDENTHAVVTRTLHVHQEYLCWVFVYEKDNDDRVGVVYVLDATNCNKIAIDSVKEGNLEPIRTLIIPRNRVKCPYIDPVVPTTTQEYIRKTTRIYTERPKGENMNNDRTTYYNPIYTEQTRRRPKTKVKQPFNAGIESAAQRVDSRNTFTMTVVIITSQFASVLMSRLHLYFF